ncbi:hypothetical protein NL676_035183 [Syzygium grande]|nr:hypothetical protein NL676_035183 [Syzygium grande]
MSKPVIRQSTPAPLILHPQRRFHYSDKCCPLTPDQTMSLSTVSSQDITYSIQSPANLQISTGLYSLILKSFKLATLKLSPFAGSSIFDVIAVNEHLEVDKELAFCFV